MYKALFTLALIVLVGNKCSFGQDVEDKPVQLSKDQMEGFREQAIKTINDLEKYIQQIVNKRKSMADRDVAVGLALDLFQSDTVTIEVSSVTTHKTNIHTIKWYLNKLELLPYKSVTIDWYEIYLSKDFTPGPGGYLYGTATFYQKFVGKTNKEYGNYHDITERKITIVIKKLDSYNGSKSVDEYQLKLGDIQVEDTKF